MAVLDFLLPALVMIAGFWQSPVFLVALALGAGYLGAKAVEVIPFTRRIIERREAEAAERG
ncbi:hypothetical protein HS048_08635 [Planomonospora sp. ID91781]|jgi:hypothetical protein|uniref:Uncharacterized protein n=3 Tax=Planomonospora TaxID=1998 RepID=A0A171CDE1_9ACTN|nr:MULTISPECIES: hypothetical protein [Planomonospora]MBG0820798.1 hypothetical protein [Planomonospora sp. ID91781]GAT66540.1 hypothetical protein PS9374_02190 [Planomonospora sphaerica]GGK56094.1 hypothetical protein GCM10010126_14670 [Planomonospora parontospora]GGL05362.1 hypothetical protein GCM10014719_04500 [Planomonospora parontospora subsp. antibiotica]GII07292.1 hypothetical protein Ppa06_10900 [Planomonospora parontospora subsp. parontospora]